MRLILDTCVLFPVATREILLNYARVGGFEPLWSPRILEEWRRVADAKLLGEDLARAHGDIALLGAHFPKAVVENWASMEADVFLPDPNDTHVVAAARAGVCDGVITFNIRDFPRKDLASFRLHALHPDEFLRSALLRDGVRLRSALAPIAEAVEAKGQSFRQFLKRGKLPRLGKVWESADAD